MTNASMAKVQAATAAEVCSHFSLEPAAKALLRDGIGPREFAEALARNKHNVAGIDFIAHALPAREAIWWGCLCLQHACGNALSDLERTACSAAVRWVLQPTDENRASARVPADAAGPGTPAGALAAAANQTGGNVAPAGAPPMAPAPFAPAKAVAIAVKLASTEGDPARMIETQRAFFELGVGVAEGRYI